MLAECQTPDPDPSADLVDALCLLQTRQHSSKLEHTNKLSVSYQRSASIVEEDNEQLRETSPNSSTKTLISREELLNQVTSNLFKTLAAVFQTYDDVSGHNFHESTIVRFNSDHVSVHRVLTS